MSYKFTTGSTTTSSTAPFFVFFLVVPSSATTFLPLDFCAATIPPGSIASYPPSVVMNHAMNLSLKSVLAAAPS